MAEPTPSDERKWWALQNRLGNVWSQIAIAPITVSLFEFAEGRYRLGAGYLSLGFVLAFVVSDLMKNELVTPATGGSPRSYRYVGVAAIILTWVLCGVTVYVQLLWSAPTAISTPERPLAFSSVEADTRLVPFAPNSRFFSELPTDTSESFEMVCFAFEPISCSIARQYRNRLADHWSPKRISIRGSDADFKGISIVTRSEDNRPDGAVKLRAQLWDSFRIDAQSNVNPALNANEFQIWIGGKP